MINALTSTNFYFRNQTNFYRGKVRDVYTIADKYIVAVASDRISAFDCVLTESVPFKGQVLNQTAAYFLEKTKDIVPNWLISTPDPHVSFGHLCEPIPIEMVVRGYLAGHAWREYKSGKREICGVPLPDGLKQNDKLPEPILTPATKAEEGHDEDISIADILKQKIVTKKVLDKMIDISFKLYKRGSEMAKEKDLILVDTKYEFGLKEGEIFLIDEVHTPDSSRYFYQDTYEKLQAKGESQMQLSKEFVREWLMDKGFDKNNDASMPALTPTVVNKISKKYIELFDRITSNEFEKRDYIGINDAIELNIKNELKKHV